MEIFDVLFILLVVLIFWALIPGFISGWMLREGGSSFTGGFALGAVCGPAGIIIALAIFISNDIQARRRRARSAMVYTHPRRIFYDIPVFGRLHVSTVWTLAGLATFVCMWALGGLFYELYLRDSYLRQEQQVADARTNTPAHAPNASVQPADAAPSAAAAGGADGTSTVNMQTGATHPQREQATGGMSPAASASQSRTIGNSSGPPIIPGMSSTFATIDAPGGQPPVASAPLETGATEPRVDPSDAPSVSTAQLRSAAVSEVTQSLSARGHRVHAALSGDAGTSTLSLSGATLTREVGNQLLGGGRTRAALRAAGVRIVVMLNGQESWTYML